MTHRFIVLVFLCAVAAVHSADWTQQFGPNRNNVIPAAVAGPLAERFENQKLKLLWQANAGFGIAPVVVGDGKVYTFGFFSTGTKPETMSEAKSIPTYDYVRDVTFWKKPPEAVFESKNLPGTPSWNRENHSCVRGEDWAQCLDATSGKQIWATKLSDFGLVYNDHQSFALASPLLSDGRLYVHANTGHLYCLNAADGKMQWDVDLYEHQMFDWSEKHGNGSSPLRFGDKVIISYLGRLEPDYSKPEGTTVTIVAAFDAATGKEAWVTKTPYYCFRGMNTSTGFAVIDGVSTVLVPCGAGTVGIDARSGAIIWKYVAPSPKGFYAPYPAYTPVAEGNLVVDVWSDTHDSEFSETRALRIQNRQASVAWNTHYFVPMSEIRKGNFIAFDGKLYGADAKGFWGDGDPKKTDGDLRYRKYRGDEIGQFQCRDLATGKLLWHTSQFRGADVRPYKWPGEFRPCSFLISGNTMVLINPWGLWIAQFGEAGATTIAHEDLRDEEGARPVLVDGRLFIRLVDMQQNQLTRKGNLLVFDLAAGVERERR